MKSRRLEYPFDRLENLQHKQPYAFARFTGEEGLAAWVSARARLESLLRAQADIDGRGPSHAAPLRWREQLGGLLNGEGFQADEDGEIARHMASAHDAWERAISRGGRVESGELVAWILIPCLDRRLALHGDAPDVAWAVRALERLLSRMEIHGRVFSLYDAHWRRVRSRADDPGPYAWLSLAAAWLSISRRSRGEAARSLAPLNALLKTLDLITAQLASRRFQPTSFEAQLVDMARVLERHLVEEVACEIGVTM